MDAIDTFKTQALDSMAQTVTALETEIGEVAGVPRARARRRRPRRRPAHDALDLGDAPGT